MAELRRMKIKISSFKAYDIRGQLPHEINPELDIKDNLWFFDCHFKGDPVMPGCLCFFLLVYFFYLIY